jgi:hypothetical protein
MKYAGGYSQRVPLVVRVVISAADSVVGPALQVESIQGNLP